MGEWQDVTSTISFQLAIFVTEALIFSPSLFLPLPLQRNAATNYGLVDRLVPRAGFELSTPRSVDQLLFGGHVLNAFDDGTQNKITLLCYKFWFFLYGLVISDLFCCTAKLSKALVWLSCVRSRERTEFEA